MNLRALDGRPLAVGHRGAAAVAAENTLESFAAAVAAGVDVVEFDVLRVDGALVLGHSPRELPAARASLDDALAFLAEAGCGAHVDVKSDAIEAEVVEAIGRHGLAGRAFVSSTRGAVLRRFAALAPELPRALTYPEDRLGLSRRRPTSPLVPVALAAARATLPRRLPALLGRCSATVASLNEAVVTRAAVERCHDLGVPVVVWTVNEPERMRELAALGVDALVSDDPRLLAATLPG